MYKHQDAHDVVCELDAIKLYIKNIFQMKSYNQQKSIYMWSDVGDTTIRVIEYNCGWSLHLHLTDQSVSPAPPRLEVNHVVVHGLTTDGRMHCLCFNNYVFEYLFILFMLLCAWLPFYIHHMWFKTWKRILSRAHESKCGIKSITTWKFCPNSQCIKTLNT